MTACVILAILATMIIATYGTLMAKAERAKCVRNLQGLYAAASSYITDHESWPQIRGSELDSPGFAKAWIGAFAPYQIGRVNWICPTIQTLIGDPLDDPDNPRVDYMATSFDDRASSPYRYPTHPWFIERAAAHQEGNLILFANGQIRSLTEIRNDPKTKRGP